MLNKLTNFKNSKKKAHRIGRGTGSGTGKTSGKGHKGQRARAGNGKRGNIGFEGGQTPLQRRLPKRGFKSLNREKIELVTIGKLMNSPKTNQLSVIDAKALATAGFISSVNSKFKLLGSSNVKLPKNVEFNISSISKQLANKLIDNGNKIVQ